MEPGPSVRGTGVLPLSGLRPGSAEGERAGWLPPESGMSVEWDQGARCWRVLGGCGGSSFTGPVPLYAPSWDLPPTTPRGTGGGQGRVGGENGAPVPEGHTEPSQARGSRHGTGCRPSPGARTPRQLAEGRPAPSLSPRAAHLWPVHILGHLTWIHLRTGSVAESVEVGLGRKKGALPVLRGWAGAGNTIWPSGRLVQTLPSTCLPGQRFSGKSLGKEGTGPPGESKRPVARAGGRLKVLPTLL